MNLTQHRQRRRNLVLGAFSLLSMLAVLAMALPVFANAETTYEVKQLESGAGAAKPPSGKELKPNPLDSNNNGKTNTGGGKNNPAAEQSKVKTPSSEESEKAGTAPGGGGEGNGNSPSGKSNPSTGQGGEPSKTVGGNEALAGNQAAGGPQAEASNASPQSGELVSSHSSSGSGGGSSPLVPILIAIAVLAAISIAVVVYRQKRQGAQPGSPSPKAS